MRVIKNDLFGKLGETWFDFWEIKLKCVKRANAKVDIFSDKLLTWKTSNEIGLNTKIQSKLLNYKVFQKTFQSQKKRSLKRINKQKYFGY